MLGGEWAGTAVIEIAQAAGLRLVPSDKRNPTITTTRGVGELIRAALDLKPTRILVGCGDSGTNDGGAGAVQALGARLLDRQSRDIDRGGGALRYLEKIILDDLDPRLKHTVIEVACNWAITFDDVTQKFSLQKGANREQMQILEAGLDRFAQVVERDLGCNIRGQPGSGASGGLAAGLAAIISARLRPRFEVLLPYLEFDRLLMQADLVITAEGCIDAQTCPGKVPAEVARRAAAREIPVIVLAGTIDDGAQRCLDAGIESYESILAKPCTLAEAIENTPKLLEAAAERLGRTISVGLMMRQTFIHQNPQQAPGTHSVCHF
jgi:glycerate kinase